jgi:hypothetical protein
MVNEHVLHAPTMRGLARTLCLCRLHAMAGKELEKRDLAAEVVQGDAFAGRLLGAITPTYSRERPPFLLVSTLGGAAVVVALACMTVVTSEAIRRQMQ